MLEYRRSFRANLRGLLGVFPYLRDMGRSIRLDRRRDSDVPSMLGGRCQAGVVSGLPQWSQKARRPAVGGSCRIGELTIVNYATSWWGQGLVAAFLIGVGLAGLAGAIIYIGARYGAVYLAAW